MDDDWDILSDNFANKMWRKDDQDDDFESIKKRNKKYIGTSDVQ